VIRETVIDKALNRLSAHFGARVVARPPVAAAELAELERLAGRLPRDLTLFLSTCNGLRVEVAGAPVNPQLWCIHDILSALRGAGGPALPPCFVPVRGEPDGLRDWLVLEVGPAQGAMLRCDPWEGAHELLASAFGPYVEAWTHYLVDHFDGQGRGRGACPAFDASFIARFDPDLEGLGRAPACQAWLKQLGTAPSCGDDFE
jgi:hypothetical protein